MGIVSVDDTGNDLGQWGAMVGDNICLRSGAIMDHENRIAHVVGQTNISEAIVVLNILSGSFKMI